MSEARPSFFDFDVTKMMSDFRFRPFDVEALMACPAPQHRGAEPSQSARGGGRAGGGPTSDRNHPPSNGRRLDVVPRAYEAGLARGADRQKHRICQTNAGKEHQPRPRDYRTCRPRPAPRLRTCCASARARASTNCATWQSSTPRADRSRLQLKGRAARRSGTAAPPRATAPLPAASGLVHSDRREPPLSRSRGDKDLITPPRFHKARLDALGVRGSR